MMKNLFLSPSQVWALLSAAFAALTAIFAKVGIENVNSDFATFIRTIVILLAAGLMVLCYRELAKPGGDYASHLAVPRPLRACDGASWICYFRAHKIGVPRAFA